MELPGVAIYDIDLNRGLLWVRRGKGKHQRVVPLDDRESAWLNKYLIESRPELIATDPSTQLRAGAEALFLTDYGPDYMAGKMKCCIQEMLGHANLMTTEIYTHVSIDKLVEIHNACHPSRLKRG
jgi:integrase/recombinase XerD